MPCFHKYTNLYVKHIHDKITFLIKGHDRNHNERQSFGLMAFYIHNVYVQNTRIQYAVARLYYV